MNKDYEAVTTRLLVYGSFLVIGVIAISSDTLNVVSKELIALISGNVENIAQGYVSILSTSIVILTVLAIKFPCAAFFSTFVEKIIGKGTDEYMDESILEMDDNKVLFFLNLTIGNFIEEFLHRWLPLGLITKITFFSSTFWFYILFLAGNLIWSLGHLENFNKKNRQLIRVFPTFIGGIFYTYIFVKYGLLATIVTHITFNVILLTTTYYTKQK